VYGYSVKFATSMCTAILLNLSVIVNLKPVPVAARSKAKVCGRSPAEIMGSNPNGGIVVCVLWMLCVVRYRSLRRADHSSRGVLPTVVYRCVWSRNLVNEEALVQCGLSRQKQTFALSKYFLIAPRTICRCIYELAIYQIAYTYT